jgi:hypothetical protein
MACGGCPATWGRAGHGSPDVPRSATGLIEEWVKTTRPALKKGAQRQF